MNRGKETRAARCGEQLPRLVRSTRHEKFPASRALKAPSSTSIQRGLLQARIHKARYGAALGPATIVLSALIFGIAGVSALWLLVIAGLAALCSLLIASATKIMRTQASHSTFHNQEGCRRI